MFRLGVLGGTFNPVHLGHLHLARVALKNLELDQVLFMPSASPPHKRRRHLCAFEHRFTMLERAVKPYPKFAVSNLEGARSGLSFTIDTLRQLATERDSTEELVFIMGFDAFVEMATWKEYERIPDYATIAVCERHGADINKAAERLFQDPSCVQPFTLSPKKISSSQVRGILADQRHDAASLLPQSVFTYIEEHGLFM